MTYLERTDDFGARVASNVSQIRKPKTLITQFLVGREELLDE